MSTKELALKTIQELPESATWEEIEEPIRFLSAMERGRKDIVEGKIFPHEEVKKNLQEWLGK